jgi:hypothetical protein
MVYDSLNITLDAELKQAFYAAEINLFVCEKCAKKTFIDAPLLYHDMVLQFCVQYHPFASINDAEFIQQFNLDGSLAMAGIPAAFTEAGDYLTRPHIVFDMNEMLRYVAFRDAIAAAHNQEVE